VIYQRHKRDGQLYAKTYSDRLSELRLENPRTRIAILRVMARDHAQRVIDAKNVENARLEKESNRAAAEHRRMQREAAMDFGKQDEDPREED
jgi:hypothetical protein